MTELVQSLVIQFDNRISEKEVHYFRGAILGTFPDGADVLLHNHIEDGFRYSYPLVQYKRIDGKAAIVCLNEGISAMSGFMNAKPLTFMLGNRSHTLCVDYVKPRAYDLATKDAGSMYVINNWIPLNAENYMRYKQTLRLVDRIEMLENILKGNILSMAKGLGVFFEFEVEVYIAKMIEEKSVTYKNGQLLAFDVEFVTNVDIPEYAGLGKNASIGAGTVTRIYQ